MLDIKKDYYLKELPFEIVPDNANDIIWAGMNNIKKEFQKNIQKSLINHSSKILVNYGSYGSGKTHSATYFSSNKHFDFVKDKNIKSFLFKFPKNAKDITKALFESFLGVYGVKNLIQDLLELKQSINFEELIKKFEDDEEVRNIIIKILQYDKSTLDYENYINEIKKILYNQATQALLNKYGLLKKVENDNVIKVFSIIIKLLTHKKYDLIIFWIDEFEDITTLNRQDVNKVVSFLRDLIDNIPQRMLTYLNFVPTTFTDLDSLYTYFIGSSLGRRISNGVEFNVLKLEDIKIYLKELFEIYRAENFNETNPYFPLEEDVINKIYDVVSSELTVGDFNKILNELFEEAIVEDIKIIDLEYFNKIKNEMYSLK